jgi:hypothetical protein
MHNKLKSENSSEFDGMTSKILEACVSIDYPTFVATNHSQESSLIILRYHSKTIVQKEVATISVTSNRQISLLTTASEVLENVMYNTLSHYLHTDNSPSSPRTVWHQGRNIHKQSGLEVTDSLLKSVNQQYIPGRLFCDFSKSF